MIYYRLWFILLHLKIDTLFLPFSEDFQIRVSYSRLHILTKVVPIIKCTCTVFIDNFRNISTNSSIYVSVCWGRYDGYVNHKRNNPICDPWDSQGNEKMRFLFLLIFALTFLSEMKYNFQGMQNKKPFEIMLHVGQVTSLQSCKGSQK